MIPWKSGHNDMLKLKRDDVQYETLLNRLREIIQKIERAQAGKLHKDQVASFSLALSGVYRRLEQ